MSLLLHDEPMTPAERDSLRSPTQNARFPFFLLINALILASGVVGVVAAFGLISANVPLAAGLLLGGTIVAVIGLFRLCSLIGERSFHRSMDAQSVRDAQAGYVRVVRLTADRAWSAPGLDEDCAAALFRVEPDRFVYINSTRLDDVESSGGGGEPLVPSSLIIRALPPPSGAILDLEHAPPTLSLGSLPEHENNLPQLGRFSETYLDQVIVLTKDQLPEPWRAMV
jgi:hypothetical protein